MGNEITVYDKEYTSWLQELKERYLSQQLKAHSAVLNYYLEFYWSVGKDIVSKQSENKYGSGFYKRLSNDLKNELPGVKGLSPTNLKYMKYFYELYKDVENRQQAVDEFSMRKFKAADLGQLGLYVSAVNHIMKKEGDNPTLGLLICKSKDDIVAQYSLESSAVPIGISEYELSKVYPVDFKSSLPTIEEIEESLKDKE